MGGPDVGLYAQVGLSPQINTRRDTVSTGSTARGAARVVSIYVWRHGSTRASTCSFFNLIKQSHVIASNRGHPSACTVNDDGAAVRPCPLPAALRILAAPPCPPPPPQKVPSGPRASSQRSPKKIENEMEYSPLLQRAEDVGETWKLPGLVLGIH